MKAFVLDPNSVVINIIEINDDDVPSSYSAIVFKEPESDFIDIGWQIINGNWHSGGSAVDWGALMSPPEPFELIPEDTTEG